MVSLLTRWFSPQARSGLLTLLVVLLGLAATSIARFALPSSAAVALAAPAAPRLESAATPAWPRTVLRLWFLLPQFLPHDS